MLWDDLYGGPDWYLIRQISLFVVSVITLMGLVGLTEDWGFFWMFESLGDWIAGNTVTFLIGVILALIGIVQYYIYKAGY